MNQDESDNELIVERYLRDEMGAKEAADFEQRLLYDENVQDEFVLAQRLREGMEVAAGGAARSVASGRSGWFFSPRYAIAASILLVATSFGWLATWLSYESELGAASSQLASARVYSIEPTRGFPDVDRLMQVTPGTTDEPVTLLVYPDLESHNTFSIQLARQHGDRWEVVWEGPPVAAAHGDTVAITLPGGLFVPGVHRLAVVSQDDINSGTPISEDFFLVPGVQRDFLADELR